jgi:hypothetical protein
MPITPMLTITLLYVRAHCLVSRADATNLHPERRLRARGDDGQATTEYALVLLAAALVGLMVVAWATAGGGTERIGRLFNSIIDAVIDRV